MIFLFVSLDRGSRAALHFPVYIKLAKGQDKLFLVLVDLYFGSLYCIAVPSLTNSSRFPLTHQTNFLSMHLIWSLVSEV